MTEINPQNYLIKVVKDEQSKVLFMERNGQQLFCPIQASFPTQVGTMEQRIAFVTQGCSSNCSFFQVNSNNTLFCNFSKTEFKTTETKNEHQIKKTSKEAFEVIRNMPNVKIVSRADNGSTVADFWKGFEHQTFVAIFWIIFALALVTGWIFFFVKMYHK